MTKDSARAFVFKHIIGQNQTYETLKTQKYSTLVKGDSLIITNRTTDPTTLILNGLANIITKNVNADNGTIQVINKPLVVVK